MERECLWTNMKQGIFHRPVSGVGIAAILLAFAFGLYLVFGGQTNSGNGAIEPLDDYTKSQLRGTGLGFIADTGRIVTHPSGHREIIWDPPQLPSLEDSIRMHAEAKATGDTDLLPLCTDEFGEYLKTQNELSGESVTPGDPYLFPACRGIPSQVGIAASPGRASHPSD